MKNTAKNIWKMLTAIAGRKETMPRDEQQFQIPSYEFSAPSSPHSDDRNVDRVSAIQLSTGNTPEIQLC